jgi:hypothetical protein
MNKLLTTGILVIVLSACGNEVGGIVASTGTVIGIEGSQSPAADSPQATIGYKRAEYTFVPAKQIGEVTEAETCGKNANGETVCIKNDYPIYATPNVLTEVYFDTILWSTLYQRMAVGETAVQQGGASIIFAKNSDGTLDTSAAAAIAATKTPTATSYGCEESCRKIDRWINDAAGTLIPGNVTALQGCMTSNGLSTGGGSLTSFINAGKFKPIREICVETLEIP